MKKITLSVLLLLPFICFSQDTSRLKQINSLVKIINQSGLITQTDSVIQDMPSLGLFIKTFVSVSIKDSNLVKYSSRTNATNLTNGVTEKISTLVSFYFLDRKLIKVEEVGNINNKKMNAEFYYFDNKPFYNTFQSDKSEARALQLLEMSKAVYNKIQPQK
jgi:hypothetical protein